MVTPRILTVLVVLEVCGGSLAASYTNTTNGSTFFGNATSSRSASSSHFFVDSTSLASTSTGSVLQTIGFASASSTAEPSSSLSSSKTNVITTNSTDSQSRTSTSPGLGAYILAGLNGVASSSTSQVSESSLQASGNSSSLLSRSMTSASTTTGTTDAQTLSHGTNASASSSTSPTAYQSSSSIPAAAIDNANVSTGSSTLHTTANVSISASNSNITTSNISSIASTGSGLDYASSCNALLLSWSSASESSRSEYTVYTTYTSTTIMTGTDYSSYTGASTTTLCDGVPHVLGGSVSIASADYLTYHTYVFTGSDLIRTTDNFTTVAKPDCTINAADCASLYSSYTSAAAKEDTATTLVTSYAQLPACDYGTVTTSCAECCSSCTIAANQVQMLYWPPTLIGNECAANHSYVTATPTRPGYPNTKVIGNQTYTSPTVYLSFDGVVATYGHEYCGGGDDGSLSTVVAMLPEDVSSIRFKQYTNCTTCHDGPRTYTMAGIYPVDYADFVGPVPADAYRGQAGCVYDACSTITDASYSPFLSVPAQLRSLSALWSDCVLYVDGIWDPPIPLEPVASEAGVTTPTAKSTTTTAAQPSSSIKSSFASSTTTTATFVSQTASTQARASSSSQASSTDPSTTHKSVSSATEDGPSTPHAADPSTSSASTSDDDQASTSEESSNDQQASTISSAGSNDQQASTTTSAAGATSAEQTTRLSSQDPGGVLVSLLADATSAATAPETTKTSDDAGKTEESQVSGQTSTYVASTADPGALSSQTVISIAGSAYTVAESGSVASVGSQGITLGADPITVGTATVSLGSSGLVVGGSTVDFVSPQDTTAAKSLALSAAGQVISAVQSGSSVEFAVGSTTTQVAAGSAVVLGGQSISVQSDGSGVVVGGSSTLSFSSDGGSTGASALTETDQQAEAAAATVTAGGQVVTISQAEGGMLVHDSSSTITLRAGSVGVFDGQEISAATDMLGVVVGGSSTVQLVSKTSEPTELTMQTVVYTNGHEFTAKASGSVVLLEDSTTTATVSMGRVATFEGQTISALSGTNAVVINGASTASLGRTEQTVQAVITANGQTMTAISVYGSSGIILADASMTTTLIAGEVAVFDGQTISAPTAGSAVVVNAASTVSLTTPSQHSQTTATADRQLFTALQSDGSVIIEDAISTLTLSASQTATFAGETIVALSGGSGVVVDGTSTTLLESAAVFKATASKTVVTASGHQFTVVESAGVTLLEDQSETITLSNGLITTVDHQTISVASTGGTVVVDGQTISVGFTGGLVVVDGSTQTLRPTTSLVSGKATTPASASRQTSDSARTAVTTTSKSGGRGRSMGKPWAALACSLCMSLIIWLCVT